MRVKDYPGNIGDWSNPVIWEIGVRSDVSGTLVATSSGCGGTVAWLCDGSGEQGDGDHTVVLTASDSTQLWTHRQRVSGPGPQPANRHSQRARRGPAALPGRLGRG